MANITSNAEGKQPLINHNPVLQSYYASLESRLGYRLLLGGTRHFGYYDNPNTWWPFPFSKALRNMERVLMEGLALPPGTKVLDAGCGNGPVAKYVAKEGKLRVIAIDVVERHVKRAQKEVKRAGLQDQVSVQRMDYHHLESLPNESFDGIYTNETFVHATDPEQVAANFLQKLRPGGHLTLHEYEHSPWDVKNLDSAGKAAITIDSQSAMSTHARATFGFWKALLEEAGFVDVQVRDLSANLKPMLMFFWLLAFLPYHIVMLLGLQKYFTNTIAGYWSYKGIETDWKHIQINARKPGGPLETTKTK